MRALIQRVHSASVEVEGQVIGRIDHGLLVYLGVGLEDGQADANYLAEKVAHLRIFQDDAGKMNLSVGDTHGSVLVVPNFTLMADARKGRRPAFVGAAGPDVAIPLYERFIAAIASAGLPVERGRFGASMKVHSEAAGPVNIVLDSLPPGGPCGTGEAAGDPYSP